MIGCYSGGLSWGKDDFDFEMDVMLRVCHTTVDNPGGDAKSKGAFSVVARAWCGCGGILLFESGGIGREGLGGLAGWEFG